MVRPALEPARAAQGLTTVPLADMPPSCLVVAWNSHDANPLIHSLIKLAAAACRSRSS